MAIASHFYGDELGESATGGLPLAFFFDDYLGSTGLLAMAVWGLGAYEAYRVPSKHWPEQGGLIP